MKITKSWLKEKGACSDGFKWFCDQKETDSLKLAKKLVKNSHWNWANWLIVRLMKYDQYVSYAVFAAEQVIDIYEKRYPNNKKPREAIETAKKCIADPSPENKKAAAAVAAAAYAAAAAAADAAAAAVAAAYAAAADAAAVGAYAAAAAAADAAAAAAADAYAAAAAAAYADVAVVAAAADARLKIQNKIIEYGISLLTKQATHA